MKGSAWGSVIGLALLAGAAQAQPAPAPGPAEAAAASKIHTRLQSDADLEQPHRRPRRGGVAVLSGKVDSEGEKAKAAKLAHVADIDIVDNRIDVGSASVCNAIPTARSRPR